ncbi:MAG: DNA polymerase III subunit epsilon, partial [Candidatus Pelagibacter sp.]
FVLTSKKFHCYLNPQRKVSEQALKVHGYTDDFLARQKKFSDIADEFLEFIKDKKLIIHNASFDLSHLNNELAILGKDRINKFNVIDTLELARNQFPGSQNSLDALCKRYKIDNSKRIKHTALVDCELLSKVYINLSGQKEPLLDLKNEDINVLKKDDAKNNIYYKKVIQPTEKDLKFHKEFLKSSQKKNYFN